MNAHLQCVQSTYSKMFKVAASTAAASAPTAANPFKKSVSGTEGATLAATSTPSMFTKSSGSKLSMFAAAAPRATESALPAPKSMFTSTTLKQLPAPHEAASSASHTPLKPLLKGSFGAAAVSPLVLASPGERRVESPLHQVAFGEVDAQAEAGVQGNARDLEAAPSGNMLVDCSAVSLENCSLEEPLEVVEGGSRDHVLPDVAVTHSESGGMGESRDGLQEPAATQAHSPGNMHAASAVFDTEVGSSGDVDVVGAVVYAITTSSGMTTGTAVGGAHLQESQSTAVVAAHKMTTVTECLKLAADLESEANELLQEMEGLSRVVAADAARFSTLAADAAMDVFCRGPALIRSRFNIQDAQRLNRKLRAATTAAPSMDAVYTDSLNHTWLQVADVTIQ